MFPAKNLLPAMGDPTRKLSLSAVMQSSVILWEIFTKLHEVNNMKDLNKVTLKPLSKYNLIQSDYKYHYPEPEQNKKGISSHLLFAVFFCMAGFLFYLVKLSERLIQTGSNPDSVVIFFSFFIAGIFMMFFKGARL